MILTVLAAVLAMGHGQDSAICDNTELALRCIKSLPSADEIHESEQKRVAAVHVFKELSKFSDSDLRGGVKLYFKMVCDTYGSVTYDGRTFFEFGADDGKIVMINRVIFEPNAMEKCTKDCPDFFPLQLRSEGQVDRLWPVTISDDKFEVDMEYMSTGPQDYYAMAEFDYYVKHYKRRDLGNLH